MARLQQIDPSVSPAVPRDLQSVSQPKSSRRGFLQACAFAMLLGIGESAHALRHRAVLRPPGGQDEETFLATCIRCDRCREICPTGAIGITNFEDGILNVRTPIMKFHIGHCTMCKKCVDVCPTVALKPFTPNRVKIGFAVVNDRCIAWSVGGCTVCKSACPYHAITLDKDNRPVIDAQACNGCGLCEKVCPALVLRSYLGGDLRGIEVRPISQAGVL